MAAKTQLRITRSAETISGQPMQGSSKMKTLFLTLALLLTLDVTAASAPVKMSKSGICHAPDSSHYDRTKNFTAYKTLQDCIASGGRLPKGYSHSQTTTTKDTGYSRSKFGSGWDDADKDCQDSRQEALIAQSTAPVRFKDGKKCRVDSGRWISPYSGAVIHDPSAIDIDHVVPLKWAWDHGASQWTKAQREQLANDPRNLLSVEASLNRQKGAKGPDEWLPPANQCQYVARFSRLVKIYKLKQTASEEKALERVLSGC
jgi:hypothetical protein